jgi:rhamnulokinase
VGRQVITGPIEATAMGNVLMQMMALGHVGSLVEAREIVRRSTSLLTYEPGSRAAWDEAYAKLVSLVENLS